MRYAMYGHGLTSLFDGTLAVAGGDWNVTGFGKLGKWQRAMLVVTSVGVLGGSLTAPLAEAAMLAPAASQTLLWLQEDAQSQPSQVGEGDTDIEPLDQSSPSAAVDEDVETLDQGAPPADIGVAPVPVDAGTVLTTAPVPVAAPATAEVGYSEPAGPWLPPGFGEGRVLVSNNPRGIPVGLEPCEVGVVSGRAYVGVNCDGSGGPVVGHSTYENFPWVIDPGFPFEPGAAVVTDPSFPFDEDSPFFESALDRTTGSDVVVLVAPRGFPFDDDDDAESVLTEAPAVSTGGVVSLAQQAREGKERSRERTRVTGSASSGDVSSNPGKNRSDRSVTRMQRATVESESKRGKKASAKHGNKAKANKKKDRKQAGKESKKQRAKSEKREKRNRDK